MGKQGTGGARRSAHSFAPACSRVPGLGAAGCTYGDHLDPAPRMSEHCDILFGGGSPQVALAPSVAAAAAGERGQTAELTPGQSAWE